MLIWFPKRLELLLFWFWWVTSLIFNILIFIYCIFLFIFSMKLFLSAPSALTWFFFATSIPILPSYSLIFLWIFLRLAYHLVIIDWCRLMSRIGIRESWRQQRLFSYFSIAWIFFNSYYYPVCKWDCSWEKELFIIISFFELLKN